MQFFGRALRSASVGIVYIAELHYQLLFVCLECVLTADNKMRHMMHVCLLCQLL